MKIYVTVTLPLSVEEFEINSDVNPELPWHDFIQALNLHKMLDKKYPDWQGYDLNIDEEDIIIEHRNEKLIPEFEDDE